MNDKIIRVTCTPAETCALDDLVVIQGNLKTLMKDRYEKFKRNIIKHGICEPVSIWKNDGKIKILNGTQRTRTLTLMRDEGYTIPPIPINPIEAKDEKEARLKLLALVSQYGELTDEGLYEYMTESHIDIAELDDYEFQNLDSKEFSDSYFSNPTLGSPLHESFIIPPFSVLDTRSGLWQSRREKWRVLIGDKGESRKYSLGSSPMFNDITHGVSILDPLLAEVLVRWFSIEKGSVCDPFAGDTAFGYVAASCGLTFTGIELRKEQVELNNKRCEGLTAKYICDDGQNISNHIQADSIDMIFSCPPYFDLEVYSDLSNDASNQESYEDFLAIIDKAFSSAATLLKNNRFACIVISDVRNRKGGFYRAMPDDIKAIFKKNGMPLYNELVLINSIASFKFRARKLMKSRKVVRIHQNVLVFYKGDPSNIAKDFPELNIPTEGEFEEGDDAGESSYI